MTEIMNVYNDALQIFLGGMNEDVINLAVVGITLTTELLFFALPIILVKGR